MSTHCCSFQMSCTITQLLPLLSKHGSCAPLSFSLACDHTLSIQDIFSFSLSSAKVLDSGCPESDCEITGLDVSIDVRLHFDYKIRIAFFEFRLTADLEGKLVFFSL